MRVAGTPAGGNALAAFWIASPDQSLRGTRLYYLAADKHVNGLELFGGRWHWRDVTTHPTWLEMIPGLPDAAGNALAAFQGDEPRVYYLDAKKKHVNELAWSSGAWHWLDVTEKAPGAVSAAGNALAAFQIGDAGAAAVYYLGDDKHVHELSWYGPKWVWKDVTAQAQGAAPAAGNSLAAFALGNERRVVYYLDAHNHVNELEWSSGAWHWLDVTKACK